VQDTDFEFELGSREKIYSQHYQNEIIVGYNTLIIKELIFMVGIIVALNHLHTEYLFKIT